jgi:replicative DNA helicase
MLAGLKEEDLYILAGRPSMGKTSFALNIVEHAAVEQSIPTLIFSLEMSAKQIAQRLISTRARVNSRRILLGELDESKQEQLRQAATAVNAAPILIDDSGALTPIAARAIARRVDAKNDLGLIVVDYLQLMTNPGVNGTREQEVSSISRAFKQLARELKVPVLALSQLSRSCESRENKRPILSDLRESGAIEQDADAVMFLFREEQYTGPYNQDGENVEGKAELNVAKQRNGPTGTLYLQFIKEITRFTES